MKCMGLLKFSFLLYIFVSTSLIQSQEIIIKTGDSWQYYDQGYLDEEWMKHPEKITWKQGFTPIGYGDDKIITKISYGDDPENKELVKYFKKEFTIKKNDFLGYEIRLLRDDGAVIYVNGIELFRSNMQEAVITNNSIPKNTIDGNDEDTYHINVFDNTIFNEGKNIITVAVYQIRPTSSDCIFSFELLGHDSNEILSKVIRNKENINKDLKYQIKDLNNKFDFEKANSQIKILEFSNYNLKLFLFIISALFILSLIIFYFLLDNVKKSKKQSDNLLEEKNKQCSEKDKEMVYISSKLLTNKQYFKEIKADLKGLKTEDKAIVKNIISDIDILLKTEEDWNILKKHFKAVYSGFYDRLLEKHPQLSESDLRHCMFIKLHMQTKEIAKILLIDPRSVQTTRYRIKKKMHLDEETDLREYLLNL